MSETKISVEVGDDSEEQNGALLKVLNDKEVDTYLRLQEFKEMVAHTPYTVKLYKIEKGAKMYLDDFTELLEEKEVGQMFGPGKFMMYVRWRKPDKEGGKKDWGLDCITYNLGRNWTREHKRYLKTLKEDDSYYEDDDKPIQESPFSNLFKDMDLQKIMATVALVKEVFGGGGNDTALLSSTMTNQSNFMIELMKNQQPQTQDINQTLMLKMIEDKGTAATSMIETMRDGMKFGMELQSDKESSKDNIPWGEIIQTAVEGVPDLLQWWVSKKKVELPEVQKVIQNDDAMRKFISQSDATHGADKTNAVINKFDLQPRIDELGINRNHQAAPSMATTQEAAPMAYATQSAYEEVGGVISL